MKHRVLQNGYVLMVISVLANGVLADEPLSAAEQEALAAAQAAQTVDETQRKIDLCHHVLLTGLPEQKAELLAKLDGMTCSEAVALSESH